MALIAMQTMKYSVPLDLTGAAIAATVGGDQIVGDSVGAVAFIVGATATSVTFKIGDGSSVVGGTVDRAIVLAANKTTILPLPSPNFRAGGVYSVTYANVTTLQVAAFRLF